MTNAVSKIPVANLCHLRAPQPQADMSPPEIPNVYCLWIQLSWIKVQSTSETVYQAFNFCQ